MHAEADLDLDLLRRWQAGETAAGNRLYKQYEAVLRQFLASKVPLHEVAELIQQTWLAMSQARGKLQLDPGVAGVERARELGNFRCYLFGIARHMVLAYYKQRERLRGVEFDPDVESLATLEPSISRQLSQKRELEWVELALQTLPLDLQLLFEAHHYEDMSGSQLAQTFGLPEGTVRSRLKKARELLNESIARLKTSAPTRP